MRMKRKKRRKRIEASLQFLLGQYERETQKSNLRNNEARQTRKEKRQKENDHDCGCCCWQDDERMTLRSSRKSMDSIRSSSAQLMIEQRRGLCQNCDLGDHENLKISSVWQYCDVFCNVLSFDVLAEKVMSSF